MQEHGTCLSDFPDLPPLSNNDLGFWIEDPTLVGSFDPCHSLMQDFAVAVPKLQEFSDFKSEKQLVQ